MKIKDIITEQIEQLTDFDTVKLCFDTKISEIGLVSLDYVAIQVALKRDLDVSVDLNEMAKKELDSFGDLIHYIESL